MQVSILPVPDAWQQFDAEQVSQAKDGCALSLGIRMNGFGMNIRLILFQKVQDRMAFPGSARRPVAHECDVVVRVVLQRFWSRTFPGLMRLSSQSEQFMNKPNLRH